MSLLSHIILAINTTTLSCRVTTTATTTTPTTTSTHTQTHTTTATHAHHAQPHRIWTADSVSCFTCCLVCLRGAGLWGQRERDRSAEGHAGTCRNQAQPFQRKVCDDDVRLDRVWPLNMSPSHTPFASYFVSLGGLLPWSVATTF